MQSVKIPFTIMKDGLIYSDALYFTPDEYAAMTQDQIDAIQQDRFDKWVSLINNPAPDSAPDSPPV